MSCYLTPDLDYAFCPGCSHGQVTDAIGAALARLAPDPARAVVVSDIGCVGLVDKHFAVNTFHGLHGRSVTYAAGLKLARPELEVLVAIGDGGTGIGGHHLIHAARRDLDITVVVYNNFNYGMTGGEHSATTPAGARTSSTPSGNPEAPLDLCALAMAAGAGFVARLPAFDRELPAVIERAARHRGFALLDVWEICTAYFMPQNDFKKKQLLELAEKSGMPFGVLRDQVRAAAAPLAPKAPARLHLAKAFDSELRRRTGLVIAGAAGQKTRSAATALGRAAIRAGLAATQKDDYPITVKSGHSVSEVILAPQAIRFTGIETPEIALLLAPEGAQRVKSTIAAMPEQGVVYADAALALPDTRARVVRIDGKGAARQVGRELVALWAVAYVAARERLVPAEALLDTLRLSTPAAFREASVAAASAGSVAARSSTNE